MACITNPSFRRKRSTGPLPVLPNHCQVLSLAVQDRGPGDSLGRYTHLPLLPPSLATLWWFRLMFLSSAHTTCDEDTAMHLISVIFKSRFHGPCQHQDLFNTAKQKPKTSLTHLCPFLSIFDPVLFLGQVSSNHFKTHFFFAIMLYIPFLFSLDNRICAHFPCSHMAAMRSFVFLLSSRKRHPIFLSPCFPSGRDQTLVLALLQAVSLTPCDFAPAISAHLYLTDNCVHSHVRTQLHKFKVSIVNQPIQPSLATESPTKFIRRKMILTMSL